ncbi:hypothetical protein NI17_021155 [Thermobifida halotolerans]|uniref:Uncharacterized protein n=1 Tax=Thermobifida halotolerans TaxID=483545 RepID=A0A399FXX9_9ACTN|nr:hypothetical protein [Thermobifida halotolerans]UOE19226.1 hypothetical protein NI17_021155 [Thermobifida halotolerans]
MRRGQPRGPLGSHDRPASALTFRLVLAVFGAVAFLVGAVLAMTMTDSLPLTVLLVAGFLAACLNVFWVSRRRRYER